MRNKNRKQPWNGAGKDRAHIKDADNKSNRISYTYSTSSVKMPVPVWAPTTSGYNNKSFFFFFWSSCWGVGFHRKITTLSRKKKKCKLSIPSRKVSAEKASRSSECAAFLCLPGQPFTIGSIFPQKNRHFTIKRITACNPVEIGKHSSYNEWCIQNLSSNVRIKRQALKKQALLAFSYSAALPAGFICLRWTEISSKNSGLITLEEMLTLKHSGLLN